MYYLSLFFSQVSSSLVTIAMIVALFVLFRRIHFLEKMQKIILSKIDGIKDVSQVSKNLENFEGASRMEKYIKNSREKGLTNEQISENLIGGGGWSDENVKKVFRNLDNGAVLQSGAVNANIGDAEIDTRKEEREYNRGSHIATIIGVIAVLFGIAFFLKYVFDNNLIGETGRIILGFVSGVVFIVIGERLRSKFKNYAMYIIGGGFALLYLSAFAGYSFYSLFNGATAFVIMIIITISATIISDRLNSKILAITATLGGFLSPVLASSGQPNEIILFGYIFILSGMIIYLSWKNNWVNLILISAIGSFALYLESFFEYYTNKVFDIYLVGILVIWFIYASAPFLYVLFEKVSSSVSSYISYFISLVSTLIFGGVLYDIFSKNNLDDYNFVIALVPAILFSLLARKALFNLKNGGEKKTVFYLLAIASFAIAMIPALHFEFDSKWVTFSWIIEAIVLSFLAFKTNLKAFSVISYVVFLPGLARLLFADSYTMKDFMFIFNERFLIYIIGIFSTFIIAYFSLRAGRKTAPKVFGVLGNLLALILIWFEVDLLVRDMGISNDFASVLLSVSYLFYASSMMYVGVIKRYSGFRLFSIVIFSFVILKTFFVDIWELDDLLRILAFIVLGFVLLGVGFYYTKNAKKIKEFLFSEEIEGAIKKNNNI